MNLMQQMGGMGQM
jgi:26S proteasome regulatory subunit N11